MRKLKPAAAARIALRYLQPGDAVLELGAADGEYTRVYAKRVGASGAVFAVEPQPGYCAELRALARVHPCITVCQSAVGAVVGEAILHTDANGLKSSSLYAQNILVPGEAYPVPVTTLDALVQQMPQAPALIQMDAQGSEMEILRGASRTLRLPCVWVVELWADGLARAGTSIEELLKPFAKAHFTPFSVIGAEITWRTARKQAGALRGWSACDVVLVPRDLMVAAA